MKILAINPGSATLKCAFFEDKQKITEFVAPIRNHSLNEIKKKLKIKNSNEIDLFGIRIVHGGEFFKTAKLLGKNEIRKLEKLISLAPLHNRPAIQLIKSIQSEIPKAKIIGVFDTNFHRSLPISAQTIPIPKKIAAKFGIRKFGFHGIACENILRKLRNRGKLPKRILICHLGGGSSITAIHNGKSVETSMAFTPNAGLPMLTRSGDLDPGIFEFLVEQMKISPKKVLKILNKESGIFGLTGKKDFAKVVVNANKNSDYKIAVEIFTKRVVEQIFAFTGTLGGTDLLIFSGGIGSGSATIRRKVSSKLKLLKIKKIEVIRADELEEIALQILENKKEGNYALSLFWKR
jgi:acetate kinase